MQLAHEVQNMRVPVRAYAPAGTPSAHTHRIVAHLFRVLLEAWGRDLRLEVADEAAESGDCSMRLESEEVRVLALVVHDRPASCGRRGQVCVCWRV